MLPLRIWHSCSHVQSPTTFKSRYCVRSGTQILYTNLNVYCATCKLMTYPKVQTQMLSWCQSQCLNNGESNKLRMPCSSATSCVRCVCLQYKKLVPDLCTLYLCKCTPPVAIFFFTTANKLKPCRQTALGHLGGLHNQVKLLMTWPYP